MELTLKERGNTPKVSHQFQGFIFKKNEIFIFDFDSTPLLVMTIAKTIGAPWNETKYQKKLPQREM